MTESSNGQCDQGLLGLLAQWAKEDAAEPDTEFDIDFADSHMARTQMPLRRVIIESPYAADTLAGATSMFGSSEAAR
jgi:hypothetical protein